MAATIFLGTTIFLSLVIFGGVCVQYTAWKKRQDEQERKRIQNWNTIFERTDLRKEPA